jgi:hypothetical protein
MTYPRDRATLARWLLAAALGMVVSGCSFVSVQRPRSPAAVDDPRVLDTCTTSSGAPIADTVLAGVGLVAGYVATMVALVDEAYCIDRATSSCHSGNPASGLAVMGTGLIFAGSAIYGYVSTAKCRHRVVAGGRCAYGDFNACQKLKPGWLPPPGWRAGAIFEPSPPTPPAAPAPSSQEWTQEPSQHGATPPAPNPR